MLWAKARKSRGYHVLSSVVALVLVMSLASPGVAAFAEQTPATPTPEVVSVQKGSEPDVREKDIVEPAPEVAVTPIEVPAEEPAVVEVPAPVEKPQPVESASKQSAPASVEVLPVTVAAVAPARGNGGGPRDDFPDPITVGEGCDLTTIAIFWAGQHYEAGTVSVRNDGDNLYVTFATTGGWTMGLTHLYVGLNPPASYAPGSFPYQTTHNPEVTSYTYTIPLSAIGASADDTVYVAAHAEVRNGEQSETAWAGVGQWPGLLFSHVVQECIEPDPADLTVLKFNDMNGNGEHDEGEPVLEGFIFTATMGDTVLEETTGSDGKAVFVDLADGTWVIDEYPVAGWVATTDLPLDIAVVAGQDVMVHIGNMELPPETLVKTFSLTYEGAPEGTEFYVEYFDGEDTVSVPLTGDGPFTGEVVLPVGATISVTWHAVHAEQHYVLGEGEPETLRVDTLNEFEYTASASGHKFNDLDADGIWDEDESGMAGWTISLYRVTESQLPELLQSLAISIDLYAVTTTGEGGAYSFGGLLPGTYFVMEEDRAGWFMTVGPEGTFEIGNGSDISGLIFGNAEEGLPFEPPDLAIEKVADVQDADPGDLVTYTLTYRNVGEGSASDFTIVDDFDERYVTVVDSAGGTVADGKITWNLPGPLSAEDGDQTIVYTVRVNADMPEGITLVENTVVISHPDDENPANDSADETVTVDNPALPFTEEPTPEEPFLPFTGGDIGLLGLAALFAMAAGAMLRVAGRRS